MAPGVLFGGLDGPGIQTAYAAALDAVQVLFRDVGLLRFDSPRTAEDFAAATALVHPDLRPFYDGALQAFLSSDRNDPALPAPTAEDAARIADLQVLGALFVLATEADGPVPQGEVVTDRFVASGAEAKERSAT